MPSTLFDKSTDWDDMTRKLIRFSHKCQVMWPGPANIRGILTQDGNSLYEVKLVRAEDSYIGFNEQGRKVVERATKLKGRKVSVRWDIYQAERVEVTLFFRAEGIPALERILSNIYRDIQAELKKYGQRKTALFETRE